MIEYGGAAGATTGSDQGMSAEVFAWAPYVAFPALVLLALAAFFVFGARRR